MPLLYHAYVYLEFLILACTIYILAPILKWFAKSVVINKKNTMLEKADKTLQNSAL